jgi:hypothetical protein
MKHLNITFEMILFREEIILLKWSYLLNKTLVIGIIFLLICINGSAILVPSKGDDSSISLITIKVAGGTAGIENWYGNDNSFNFTYESGEVARIYYGIDGDFSLYNDTFNVTEKGEHDLEWYAVNHTGNKSEIDGPFNFKIDKTVPEIDIYYEVIGGNPYQGWIFEFAAIGTDFESGMDRVEFYLSYVVQETVYGPGPEYIWRVRYWPIPNAIFGVTAYDKAGNLNIDEICEPCNSGVLGLSLFNKVASDENRNNVFLNNVIKSKTTKRENHRNSDKIPSDSNNKEVFNPAYVLVEFNRYYRKNDWIVDEVSIPILYEPDRIDEVYYQINNLGWKLYNKPIEISEDGIYDFSWYVVDSESHNSTIDSIPTFKIDLTPPDIHLTQERLAINKVKFKAEVNDETSGIDKVRFKSRYDCFIDYDYPYEWIWCGFLKDKVTVTVYDNAGNVNIQSMNTCKNHNNNYKNLNLIFLRFLERFSFLEIFSSLLL